MAVFDYYVLGLISLDITQYIKSFSYILTLLSQCVHAVFAVPDVHVLYGS